MVFNKKNTVSFKRMTRSGFTLLEIVVATTAGVILIFSIGALLAGSQKQLTRINTRVNGEAVTDSYVAARVFDSVCRKASWKICDLGSNKDELKLYYYQPNSVASIPENYAQFYLNSSQLWVKYGSLKSGTWTLDSSVQPTQVVLAEKVQSVQFRIQGKAVSMVLYFDPATGSLPVSCTAVRNNR